MWGKHGYGKTKKRGWTNRKERSEKDIKLVSG
jgi:hypothetical protein